MTAEESYLLAVVARELYRATLSGDAPSLRTELRERMHDPRPGDLVLEVSTMAPMTPERFDPDRLGRLVRVEGEDPGQRFVVAPLHDPEREQGWQNATFVAIPDRWKWAEVPAVSR